MHLFSVETKIIYFFPLENINKMATNIAHNRPQTFFFSCPGPAAQTSPELIFHVINMSQDASVLLSVLFILPASSRTMLHPFVL